MHDVTREINHSTRKWIHSCLLIGRWISRAHHCVKMQPFPFHYPLCFVCFGFPRVILSRDIQCRMSIQPSGICWDESLRFGVPRPTSQKLQVPRLWRQSFCKNEENELRFVESVTAATLRSRRLSPARCTCDVYSVRRRSVQRDVRSESSAAVDQLLSWTTVMNSPVDYI